MDDLDTDGPVAGAARTARRAEARARAARQKRLVVGRGVAVAALSVGVTLALALRPSGTPHRDTAGSSSPPPASGRVTGAARHALARVYVPEGAATTSS